MQDEWCRSTNQVTYYNKRRQVCDDCNASSLSSTSGANIDDSRVRLVQLQAPIWPSLFYQALRTSLKSGQFKSGKLLLAVLFDVSQWNCKLQVQKERQSLVVLGQAASACFSLALYPLLKSLNYLRKHLKLQMGSHEYRAHFLNAYSP